MTCHNVTETVVSFSSGVGFVVGLEAVGDAGIVVSLGPGVGLWLEVVGGAEICY